MIWDSSSVLLEMTGSLTPVKLWVRDDSKDEVRAERVLVAEDLFGNC